VFLTSYRVPDLATTDLLKTLLKGPGAPAPANAGRFQLGGLRGFLDTVSPFQQVGHCLWALLFASLGARLSQAVFGTRGADLRVISPDQRPVRQPLRWRRSPLAVVAAGLILMMAIVAGSRRGPEFSVGATLLMTWGVVGTALLGAAGNRGTERFRWLGAALFGAGYMLLVFGPDPYVPTWSHHAVDTALRAAFSWIPDADEGYPVASKEVARANARIREALEQPVPMHFSNETPLEDVLKSLRKSVRRSDGTRLPIYLDPVGLIEAEKTMASPISLDLDGVPLRASLRLLLMQLGMTYHVTDGLLLITSESSEDASYHLDNPALAVGHCLLALLAAILGAALAPLVVAWSVEKTTEVTAA
jgi:hypothetical protein